MVARPSRVVPVLSRLLFILTSCILAARSASAQALPDCLPGCGGTYSVAVVPDGQTMEATAGSTVSVSFDVLNQGTNSDTYDFACSTLGSETCVGVSPSSMTLGARLDGSVTVTFTAGSVGTSGTVTLTATGHASDVGSYSVSNAPGSAPTVDVTPYNYERQDMSRCSVSCFAATYAQSTVPYFSLDASHSVSLTYHGDRVDPKPFIHVNVQHGGGNLPTAFWLQARKSDGTFITFLNGETTLRFAPSTVNLRLAGQFDAAANGVGQTGVYGLDIIVTAEYPAGTRTVVNSKKLVVVNETGSPIARGWTLGGIERLYVQSDGSALITEGEGSAVYFQKVGTAYATPPGDFSTLVTGTPSGGLGWTRLFPDSTKVALDNTGRTTEVRDRFNNITTVVYDGSGRVSQVKDPLNLALTLIYGANGLSSIQDPAGRVTGVTVDASRRLVTIQDPDNVSTTFAYDASLRLSGITDRSGAVTTLSYDGQSGKLATVTAPAVPLVDGSTASPVTTFVAWQQVGVPYGSTSTPFTALKADTVFGRVTDPAGALTRFTVDRFGAPTQVLDPLAQTTTILRDGSSRPYQVTTPNGHFLIYTYSGPVLTQAYDYTTGRTVNYAYNAWNDLTTASGDVAREDVYYHDGSQGPKGALKAVYAGNTSTYASPTGGIYTATHYPNSRGQDTLIVDAAGHRTSLTYGTSWLNLIRTADARGDSSIVRYDALGRADSTFHSLSGWTVASFDPINRTTRIVDPLGRIVTYGYGPLTLDRVTDAKGQIYRLDYNAAGWLVRVHDLADTTKADTLKYDIAGRLRQKRTRRGDVIALNYDAVGRLVSRSGPDFVTDTFRYDAAGRWVTAQNAYGYDSLAFDAAGRPVLSAQQLSGGNGYATSPLYQMSYTYDVRDRLISRSAPTGGSGASYWYHPTRGTLDTLCSGGSCVRFARNQEYLDSAAIYSPGQSGQWSRIRGSDATHNAVTDSFSVAALNHHMQTAWTYDSLNRVTDDLRADDIVEPAYAYDVAGRLSGSQIMHPYSYDSADNRRDWESGSGAVIGPGNRTTDFFGYHLTYDPNGDVLTKYGTNSTYGTDSSRYTWDALARLTQVEAWLAGGAHTTVTFRYDALGRRIAKSVNGAAPQWYVYDGDQVALDVAAATQIVQAEYGWLPGADNLLGIRTPTVAAFTITDPQIGSVNALAAQQGATLIKEYRYPPWGDQPGSSVPPDTGLVVRFRWAARELDQETGLYYMRARYYDPRLGRFLSEDPAGIGGGLNLYAYAGNDPVNQSDATGLCGGMNGANDTVPCPLDPIVAEGCSPSAGDYGCPRSYDCTLYPADDRLGCGLPDSFCPSSVAAAGNDPCGNPEGGGAAGGSDNGAADVGVQAEQRCASAILETTFSLVSDILLANGVIKAIRLSRSAGVVARYAMLRSQDGARAVARGVGMHSVEMGREALATYNEAILEGTGRSAGIGGAWALANGGDFSWKDLVPIWGTVRAGVRAFNACF